MAQLLGLHRNCDDWDIPRNEKETRKRVWWALYITDRFQTAILGRPINLRDEVRSLFGWWGTVCVYARLK